MERDKAYNFYLNTVLGIKEYIKPNTNLADLAPASRVTVAEQVETAKPDIVVTKQRIAEKIAVLADLPLSDSEHDLFNKIITASGMGDLYLLIDIKKRDQFDFSDNVLLSLSEHIPDGKSRFKVFTTEKAKKVLYGCSLKSMLDPSSPQVIKKNKASLWAAIKLLLTEK